MFSNLFSWFKQPVRITTPKRPPEPVIPAVKKIAFIDGDQPLTEVLKAYHKHVANTGTETHLIRATTAGHGEPRQLRSENDFNKIYLEGMSGKKEVTDKFIAGFIQKAVSDGYTHITVISSDYDFIDIFKMAVMIDPHASEVTFRIIVPHGQGRLKNLPNQIANVQVVKM